MTKLIRERILRAGIYTIFVAALLLVTLAAGRYVSKGTYADQNYILTSGALVGALAFYAISGIIRPRPRRRR